MVLFDDGEVWKVYQRGVASTVAWEQELTARVEIADWYDKEIELCADYRPKGIVRPEQVWQIFADIENVTLQNARFIAYARNMVDEQRQQDFQRRF